MSGYTEPGDRPEMPHRNSSTKGIPQQQPNTQPLPDSQPQSGAVPLSDTHNSQSQSQYQSQPNVPQQEELPPRPVQKTATVARASHRGEGHGESKPAPSDGHGAAHGTEKVDLDGPPQPNMERAEAERKERAELAKKAESEGRAQADYPEQVHAGQVGLGPAIGDRDRATMGDKISGFKEVIAGKVKRNPELVETGHSRITGDLKRQQREQDDAKNPFGNAKTDDSEKKPGDAPAQAGDAPADKAPQESQVPRAHGDRDVSFRDTNPGNSSAPPAPASTTQ
ncbi:hypothetical protein EXIGLDRAFT_719151 [Exidia glandulosa HHB12029]|uniref:Uncharacterized protein n=1 Tax=Exidia glandulosa HHB12029 TaxID=1314781 RepID=A0A166AGH4_EXIGL|nr:hypothetical protein EXIGLDRAFT_719151 [Exidia glandulosa HHB12029]